MIDWSNAAAALGDPRTPAGVLFEIAQAHVDLREAVAFHPSVYPGLLDWLAEQGNPRLTAAVQVSKAQRASGAAPGDRLGSFTPVVPRLAEASAPVGQGVPVRALGSPVPLVPAAPSGRLAPGPSGNPATLPQPPYRLPYGYPFPVQPGKSGVERALDSITGLEGEAIIKFRDLFRDTFKRHSRDDMDALMYAGTRASLHDRQWRLPWLYLRVFGVLLGAFLLLWFCMLIFRYSSGNVIPGVIFTGALVIPATLMVFFWEFNQAKNVSFFDVIRIFFIGGALSILLTFIVSTVTDLLQSSSAYGIVGAGTAALFIGFTEELAKVVVVIILVRKLYGCLVSNGLLIGAIVGTGFAVFETMGYATSAWANGAMEWTLLVRGILSLGGHTIWTAIAGAAVMLAQPKGGREFSLSRMNWGRFLALFAVPFALHSLWDFFAFTVYSDLVYLLFATLFVLGWIFVIRLINTGLRQYADLIKPSTRAPHFPQPVRQA